MADLSSLRSMNPDLSVSNCEGLQRWQRKKRRKGGAREGARGKERKEETRARKIRSGVVSMGDAGKTHQCKDAAQFCNLRLAELFG